MNFLVGVKDNLDAIMIWTLLMFCSYHSSYKIGGPLSVSFRSTVQTTFYFIKIISSLFFFLFIFFFFYIPYNVIL